MLIKANKKYTDNTGLHVDGYLITHVKEIFFNDTYVFVTYNDESEERFPKEEITRVGGDRDE